MKTLFEVKTKGDHCTLPGGITIRQRDDGTYVVHDYAICEGRRGHTNGGYFEKLSNALADFARRVERAEYYDLGGALDMPATLEALPA